MVEMLWSLFCALIYLASVEYRTCIISVQGVYELYFFPLSLLAIAQVWCV